MENLRNLNDESDGRLINQPCHTCGKETATERPEQQSHLLNLPNEILNQIIEDVPDRHSLKALISTCSDLFHLGLPTYRHHYCDDWWLFIKAALTGDVPLLNICAANDAVPQDLVLTSIRESLRVDHECWDHSSVLGKVLERFSLGVIPFDAAYRTLVWLFKRGHDAQLGIATINQNMARFKGQEKENILYEDMGFPKTAMIEDLDEVERVMHQHTLDPNQYVTTKHAHHCQCSSQTTNLLISSSSEAIMDDLNDGVPSHGQVDYFRERPIPPLGYLYGVPWINAISCMNQCWMMLVDNPTKEKTHQVIQFIQLLRRYGELCPTGFVCHFEPESELVDYLNYKNLRNNVMVAAFQMHCPPILLEILLEDFEKRALVMNEDHWEEIVDMYMEFWADEHYLYCGQIFLPVLNFLGVSQGMVSSGVGSSQNWVASHPREPLDMLTEKVKILRRWNIEAMEEWIPALEQGLLILEEAYTAVDDSVFDESAFRRYEESLLQLVKDLEPVGMWNESGWDAEIDLLFGTD